MTAPDCQTRGPKKTNKTKHSDCRALACLLEFKHSNDNVVIKCGKNLLHLYLVCKEFLHQVCNSRFLQFFCYKSYNTKWCIHWAELEIKEYKVTIFTKVSLAVVTYEMLDIESCSIAHCVK
jgi:hypothetical protein